MKNHLLAFLPEQDRQILFQHAKFISLRHGKELYRRGEPIDAVYFPFDCVISILAGARDDATVEMATIGNEGAVGAASILNPERAIGINVVQVAGDALRIGTDDFREYLRVNPVFDHLIRRYLYAFMHQIIQAGACNRLHTVKQRCARWLLMTHDRAGAQTFLLTQEYLSEMLGVRRATVNLAIGAIKTAGIIKYVRGRITVLDRSGLESISCRCYQLIRQEYEQLSLQ